MEKISQEYSFDIKQYKIISKIGKGGFGVVYKVEEKSTGLIFAAKVSKNSIEEEDNPKALIRNLSREINILSNLSHPSVVKFVGFSAIDFKGEFKPVLVTELMSRGSLEELIEQERQSCSDKKWNETRKLITLYGIASAMTYLHSRNIIHRDLKPDNILMDDQLYPKIADFGLSKITHSNESSKESDSTFGFKGTFRYSSPEAISSYSYSKAGDVYSYGMIMFEILTTEKPFKDCNLPQLIIKLNQGQRPEFTSPVLPSFRMLIEKCWSQEPEKRPTFLEILSELKNNSSFITPLIDENEYLNYIDYLEEFQAAPETPKLEVGKIIQKNYEERPEKMFSNWRKFFYGFGVNIDKKEAARFGKMAADNGHVNAMFNYALMLSKGDGIPKNEGEAARYFKMAADKDHVISMYSYAIMLYKGTGIKVNKKEAAIYMKKAADNGQVNAIYYYGIMLKKGEGIAMNKSESINYFKKAADMNHLESMVIYANMLFKGEGVPVNKSEAAKYYKKAADDHGHLFIILNYSQMLNKGEGVAANKAESTRYLKMAADQGDVDSIYNYGLRLSKGYGI